MATAIGCSQIEREKNPEETTETPTEERGQRGGELEVRMGGEAGSGRETLGEELLDGVVGIHGALLEHCVYLLLGVDPRDLLDVLDRLLHAWRDGIHREPPAAHPPRDR